MAMSARSQTQATVHQLQAVVDQAELLASLLEADQCTANAECVHGERCRSIRAKLAHSKGCRNASCAVNDCIVYNSRLQEYRSHPDDTFRRNCFHCRYVVDPALATHLKAAIAASKQTSGQVVSSQQDAASSHHVCAALQPAYRIGAINSRNTLLGTTLLQSVPADRQGSTRYNPGQVHLNVLLATLSDRHDLAAGIAGPQSSSAARVHAELSSRESAALAARAEGDEACARADGAHTASRGLEALVNAEVQVRLAAATLASKESVLQSRFSDLESKARSGGPALLHSAVHSGMEAGEVKAALEAWALAEVDASKPVAETRAALDALQSAADRVRMAFANNPACASMTVLHVGVCAPRGAGLALRMLDRVHAAGVLLHRGDKLDGAEGQAGAAADAAGRDRVLRETGCGPARAAEAVSPALLVRMKGAREGAGAGAGRGAEHAALLGAAMQAAAPHFARGDESRSGAVAYARDALTEQALHLLSGVLAVSRARQGREIDALALTSASCSTAPGCDAQPPSTVGGPAVPATMDKLQEALRTACMAPITPRLVRDSTSISVQGVWKSSVAAWAAWYEAARAQLGVAIAAGTLGKGVKKEAMMSDLRAVCPLPDAALEGNRPNPSVAPVHLKVGAAFALARACADACAEYYGRAIEVAVDAVISQGAGANVAAYTPETVAQERMRNGQVSALSAVFSDVPLGLQAGLLASVPVTDDGRMVLHAHALPRAGVNARVTVQDVMEYLCGQMNGAEPLTGMQVGGVEGEGEGQGAGFDYEAPTIALLRESVQDDAPSSRLDAEGAVTGGGGDVEMEEEDEEEAEEEATPLPSGRAKETEGEGAGVTRAGLKRKRAVPKHLREDEEEGTTRMQTGPARGRKAPLGSAPSGAPSGKKARYEDNAGAVPTWDGKAVEFTHLPRASGQDGVSGQGPVLFTSRADLDSRLAILRSVGPKLGSHPRAVGWLRAACARARAAQALLAERGAPEDTLQMLRVPSHPTAHGVMAQHAGGRMAAMVQAH